MKKSIALLLVLLPAFGFAQSIGDRLKQKVKNRVEQRTDEGMERAIDEAENGVKKGAKGKGSNKEEAEVKESEGAAEPAAAAPSTATAAKPAAFKSYSRYDFVPGDEIVFAEDFAQDVIGEFPLKWSTNNRGEAVTIEGLPGKWLRMFLDGHFVSPYIKTLPENFTAEWDMVLQLPENTLSTSYPQLEIRLMNVDAGDDRARKFFTGNFEAHTDVRLVIQPFKDDGSRMSIFTTQGGHNNTYFSHEGKELKKLGSYMDKPIHFAVWIQKERFRMWINGEKVYDLPQAVPLDARFNRVEFQTGNTSYDEGQIGCCLSNIKFAQGAPDMRSKLLTEGKLVTNGILFDVASDKIKPESFGVLQEIAKVLKENPAVKVKIVGHTDNNGEDAANLQLSRQRAAAVRQALSTEFGIDGTRIQTDGKGESQPVSDNTSKEGKAKNRRVEFIRL